MILVLSDFTLIHTFMDLFYEYKDQQKRIQNPDKHLRTEKRLQLFNYVFIREHYLHSRKSFGNFCKINLKNAISRLIDFC